MIAELEGKLADAARSYLAVRGRDDDSEAAALQDLRCAIDGILDAQLRQCDAWNPHHYTEGILASVEIPSPGVLDLQGFAIWAKDKTSGQYWEPFAATIRLSASGNLIEYEIKFADADFGLGKVPYNTHPRGWNCAPPRKWMFAFPGPLSLS